MRVPLTKLQIILDSVGDPKIDSADSTVADVLGDPGAGKNITLLVGDVQDEVDKIGSPEIDSVPSTLGAVLGDPGEDKDISGLIDDVQDEVDKIGSPEINSAASTLAAVLGDPGEGKDVVDLIGDVQDEVDKIGAPEIDSVPSTLGAVLGDPGDNKDISQLIIDAHADVNVVKNTTDSIDERVRSLTRHIVADCTAWSVGDHVVFTVTGDVLVRVFGTVQTGLTSEDNGGTLEVGVEDATDALLPTTAVVGTATRLDAGDVWASADADAKTAPAPSAAWDIIAGGANIILTVKDKDITAGAATLYCEWIPLSEDGNVA